MSFEYGTFLLRPNERHIVRPVPRHVSYIASSFVTTPTEEVLRPWQSTSQFTVDSGIHHEILDICVAKNACGDVSGFGFGRSPPYFSGSPPSRARNPVVRDVKFSRDFKSCHQAPPTPPTLAPQSPPPVYRGSPCVRVEGFDCPGHVFESCTGRDTRRHVFASA